MRSAKMDDVSGEKQLKIHLGCRNGTDYSTFVTGSVKRELSQCRKLSSFQSLPRGGNVALPAWRREHQENRNFRRPQVRKFRLSLTRKAEAGQLRRIELPPNGPDDKVSRIRRTFGDC